jgi:hypothetical protein
VQDLPMVVEHPTSPFARALAGETINGEEHDLRVGSSATRRVRISATPVRDETRAVIGGALVLMDAAERPGAEASGAGDHGNRGPRPAQPVGRHPHDRAAPHKGDDMPTERPAHAQQADPHELGRMDSIVKGLLDYARARAGALVRPRSASPPTSRRSWRGSWRIRSSPSPTARSARTVPGDTTG